jgi:hypothetical protein
MHLTGQYWVCALQIAFSDNNKTPPMCKTRGRRGWVLMRQPSRPNASRSVIQQPHTHIYGERERERERACFHFLLVSIFVF